MSYPVFIDTLDAGFPVQLDVLRLDLINKEFGGNKWFKLRHNISFASALGKNTLLTFGGAFSNHIAATAAAAKFYGFKSVGIMRGEPPKEFNPTLKKAVEDGMNLHFVSREEYKQKNHRSYKLQLQKQFPNAFIIPEGGNNVLGIEGCKEIIPAAADYDFVACACGTASTFKGILDSLTGNQKIIGISVLKGENQLQKEVTDYFDLIGKDICVKGNEAMDQPVLNNHCLVNSYHLGGYAALNNNLVEFKKRFENKYKIQLDYVYTAKLFYAVFDLMQKNKFPAGSKILAIHSGGTQGNIGFEQRYHLNPSL